MGALILALLWLKLSSASVKIAERKLIEDLDSSSKNVLSFLKNKQLWLLTGLFLCAGTCYDTLMIWLPSILKENGFSVAASNGIASMLPIGFLLAPLAVGLFSDRLGSRKLLVMLLGLVSGPAVYLVGTSCGPIGWFFAFLVGFCTQGIVTLVLAMQAEMQPMIASSGATAGLISSLGSMGTFLIPTIIGQMRDSTGSFLWGFIY